MPLRTSSFVVSFILAFECFVNSFPKQLIVGYQPHSQVVQILQQTYQRTGCSSCTGLLSFCCKIETGIIFEPAIFFLGLVKSNYPLDLLFQRILHPFDLLSSVISHQSSIIKRQASIIIINHQSSIIIINQQSTKNNKK